MRRAGIWKIRKRKPCAEQTAASADSKQTAKAAGQPAEVLLGEDVSRQNTIKVGGKSAFEKFKSQIISEFNALGIDGMPEITELYCLCGSFVNLEYPLPSGKTAKFLNDQNIYLGTQADCELVDRCFGLVADMNFLLVCEYGENGTNPDIVVYKKR